MPYTTAQRCQEDLEPLHPFKHSTDIVIEHSDSDQCQQRHRHVFNHVGRMIIVALLIGMALFPALSWVAKSLSLVKLTQEMSFDSMADIPICESLNTEPFVAPRQNIWKNVPLKDATDIREWLWAPERDLNLTKTAVAVESDNSIFLIEAYTPSKSEALKYLDFHAEPPQKYAHAIIHHGTTERIADYLIGPLPISNATTMRPLTEIYHRPDIPYNAHGFLPNSSAMGLMIASIFEPLADVTMDLFGAVARGEENDTLIAGGNAPLSYDGTWRRMWVQLKLNVPGHYLLPVDLYTYLDMTGTDPANWHVIRMVYNNQTFASPEDFKNAWATGKLKRSAKPVVSDTSGWASRSRTNKGCKRDLDERAGPRSVSFDGLRFRVDPEQQYITWMGWSFFLGFERDMGMNLWDINFRGERIIYEISPQEAMAQYSGTDPHQATTVFLDRAFGMGSSVKELMVGYDCPAEAIYLPATVHEGRGSSTRINAICVFEKDSGKPLSRHTGWLKDEMGAIKGYELTVRSVSTVGNYDYLFDYTFQLDGTIELRVSASGYLQGGYWNENQNPYGHRIRDTSMGSVHDHVINYKVDFDIAGTRNSFVSAMLEMEEITQPWVDDAWGDTYTQQKVVKKMISTEDDSKVDYPKNMEGNFLITNEDAKNSWGYSRGYAIHPGEHNVDWAKQSLAVTQRHDNEPYSSSTWNIHLPGAPTVDFSKFFDGESLYQEDLVVWINLGTHHVPRAEDSPQTLTNVATSYVLLTPFNFNDFDVSMEAMNAILLNAPQPGEAWKADENNVKSSYCLPQKLADFSYSGIVDFEEDGSPARMSTILEQRKIAESWHGLHAEK